MTPGYVYILMNASLNELLKIGQTTRTAEERARELSAHTGVAAPYCVVHAERVPDCHLAERLIHERLDQFRYSKKREFFDLPLAQALDELREIAEEVRCAASPPAAVSFVPVCAREPEPCAEALAPPEVAPSGDRRANRPDAYELDRLRRHRRKSQQQGLYVSAVILTAMVLLTCCAGLFALIGLSKGAKTPSPPNKQWNQPASAKPKAK